LLSKYHLLQRTYCNPFTHCKKIVKEGLWQVSVDTEKVFNGCINRDSCVMKLGQKLSSCRNRIVFFSHLLTLCGPVASIEALGF
jgi:hypothetical protein